MGTARRNQTLRTTPLSLPQMYCLGVMVVVNIRSSVPSSRSLLTAPEATYNETRTITANSSMSIVVIVSWKSTAEMFPV